MIDTLHNLIIPALPSSFQKGQALSIAGILNNLVGRTEETQRFYVKKNANISRSLKEVVNYFGTGESVEVPKQIEELCQKIIGQLDRQYGDQETSYKAKNIELNGLIEEILKVLEEQKDFLSPNIREDIRKTMHQQLRQQLDEDLSALNIFEMTELFKR
jgi:hypothetical protein